MAERTLPRARVAGAGLRLRTALRDGPVSRRARSLAFEGRALVTALDTLERLERLAWVPDRPARVAGTDTSDIQFDLDGYLPQPSMMDGVQVPFPPVHTVFATARLVRTPTGADRAALADALDAIEAAYPWAPRGVITHVAYGLPYFRRLPVGLLALHLPRLLADTTRYALEEAVPGPADVHHTNPGIAKRRFHVPVRIEHNDLLLTLRGDDARQLADVLAWLGGTNRLAGRRKASLRLPAGLAFTSGRAMFVQPGLPRRMADAQAMPFAHLVNPRSPLWMAFVEYHARVAAPAPVVTFAGARGVRLTTAQRGDYFDHGSVQHLAHDILDLHQFYGADDDSYLERVREMYRSAPRTARTADGRPLHLRIDGPGLDPWDVPDGTSQPKLQFSVFVPTADLFATMRLQRAALDLSLGPDSGLERFVTATRRQNFLVPPRRHRAFPLIDLL